MPSVAEKSFASVSDTGQTVVDRHDTPDVVQLSIIQNKFSYGASTPERASVEYQLNIAKSEAPAELRTELPPKSESDLAVHARTLFMQALARLSPLRQLPSRIWVEKAATLVFPWQAPEASTSAERATTARQSLRSASAERAKVTLHRLRSWNALEAAPPLVQKQAGCLGLPSCQLRVHHLSFDQVSWEKPSGVTRAL